MSWAFDAPSGTYRNHALSTKIRREAIADAQFMKFFRPEPGYGRRKGESVTITRILRLPLATRVNEVDILPSGRPPIETKQVNVSQWGFTIPMTEFEKMVTHYDIMEPFRSTLREQITLTMDKMCADALKLTPVKYVPTSVGGTFSTNGVAGALSNRNWEVQDLRRVHDRLHGDLKVPKFANGRYGAIFSTLAARGIKNDPEYKEWIAPTSSEPLMTGRLKSIENFDILETNHFDSLDNSAGTSTTTGEAIFFGADAGGLVTVMDPEIRMGEPENLGTFVKFGWVGALEAFLVWERAALARAIHGTST